MSLESPKVFNYIIQMIPRSQIIENETYAHVIFRCHNRDFLLKPKEIKTALLNLWAKYKDKYEIKILDFIIMDNHAHLIVFVPDADHLANFMRTVNSQLARIVNNYCCDPNLT